MLGFSFTEILFLAVLALIVIGPKQLPEVARTIGRFLNDLKRSTENLKDEFKIKIDQDFDVKRNEIAEQMKKQQEILKAKEQQVGLPIPEEDRQLTIQGLEPQAHSASDIESSESTKKENS